MPRSFARRDELDQVVPNNPVLLQASYREAYLNSQGLKVLGIGESTTADASIVRDSAGKPTGTFKSLQIYKDGAIWFTSDSQFFEIATGLPAGPHRITAKGWDSAGAYSTTINVTSTGN